MSRNELTDRYIKWLDCAMLFSAYLAGAIVGCWWFDNYDLSAQISLHAIALTVLVTLLRCYHPYLRRQENR